MKSLVGVNIIFDYDTTYKSFTLGIYLGKSIICFNFDHVLNKKDCNKAKTTVGPPLLPIKPLHNTLPLTNLRGGGGDPRPPSGSALAYFDVQSQLEKHPFMAVALTHVGMG